MSRAAAAMLALAVLLVLTTPAAARTFTVTDRGDHEPGACTRPDCTLREAIIAANKRPGGDTVLLPQRKRYELSIESTGEDAAADGDLDITSGPLKLIHRRPGTATIDANRIDRVLDIGAARTRIERLTIRGGSANPIDAGGDGGGIAAGDLGDAPVTIVRSRIVDNRSPSVDGNGGGIDTDIAGPLRLVRSTVARNDAGGDGGGVTGSIDGPLIIERSTITDNEGGEGAGVMAVGPVTILESTIAGNRSVSGGDGELGDGGGIYVDDQGILALTNATIAENTAIRSGAGIFGETGAVAAINSATVAHNRADTDGSGDGQSGGVHVDLASFEIANSILAFNTAGGGAASDCGGATFAGSPPNLLTTTGGGACAPGSEIVADPLFAGGLAANGGPTETIALAPGSPAIAAADPALAPAIDQRGVARSDPDLGAFELLSD